MLKTVARRRIVDGPAARARHANLPPLTTKTTQEAILFRVTRVEEGEVIGAPTGVFIVLRLALRDAGPAGCPLRDAGIVTHLASPLQASAFVRVVFRALSFTLG